VLTIPAEVRALTWANIPWIFLFYNKYLLFYRMSLSCLEESRMGIGGPVYGWVGGGAEVLPTQLPSGRRARQEEVTD
jgi:hypothetical protein